MTIHLPDERLIQRFTAVISGADDAGRDIALVHKINIGVVAVFVLLAFVSGLLSYNASKSAEQANNAIHTGIYDKDGWSVIEGATGNEWVYSQEHPKDYARWKELNPGKGHF